jgi:predicted RNase H-like HicB family nuclease
MTYTVVLHKTEEGYSVHCPALHGCWSQGATEAEALENISTAIAEYLAAVEAETLEQFSEPEYQVRHIVLAEILA